MKLRSTKALLGAAAAVALAWTTVDAQAQNAAATPATGGSFIVASQVVSDTVATPSYYVGDLASATDLASAPMSADCASGNCSGDMGGSCANGQCGAADASGGNGGSGLGGCLGNLLGHNDAGSIGCQPKKYDQSDLFYNYYSQGNCNSANAQMYISPMPVPHFVGHTFNTYQPFYPEEFLYWHKNKFHNQYDNGRGMNRTRATYYAPPVKTFVSNLYWNKLRLPR